MTDWIGAAEAAERLGIKQASLYAYVSRGVLSRRREADGRASMFDADEVQELARKGRPRRTGGPAELVIESELTEITPETQRYRGYAATELALRCSFEDVAVLLWTGSLPAPGEAMAASTDAGRAVGGGAGAVPGGAPEAGAGADPAGAGDAGRAADAGGAGDAGPGAGGGGGGGWQATAAALAAGRAAQAGLPAATLPLERLQVIVPALAATDQFRLHLDRPAVMAAGKSLIAGMIGALPATAVSDAEDLALSPEPARRADAGGRGRPRSQLVDPWPSAHGERPDLAGLSGPVAGRLAARLCAGPVPPGLVRVLNAALVLLADHEMAASTLAARVAASMRADPYAVVATGLGAMGGALHGGAALGAELMLSSASSPADAPRVVGDVLRRGERLPGFGHFVYKNGDPRANLLLELVAAYAPGSPQLAVASAVTDEARRRALPEPNIEFALAVLAGVAGMIRGAGEAIFATGRAAGWLAHALEEYERNTPIRPRGVYTGRTAAG
jgi:citrate synthase